MQLTMYSSERGNINSPVWTTTRVNKSVYLILVLSLVLIRVVYTYVYLRSAVPRIDWFDSFGLADEPALDSIT